MTSIYDTDTINQAIRTSGLNVSELAHRADISIAAIERLLGDTPDPGEMRIATLVRIAEQLGLPLRSMFAPPHKPPEAMSDEATVQGLETDAQRVIALIYDRGSTPTLNTDLVAALGWDLDRLTAAYREADRRLRTSGLRLYGAHGEATIQPLDDHTQPRHTQHSSPALAA